MDIEPARNLLLTLSISVRADTLCAKSLTGHDAVYIGAYLPKFSREFALYIFVTKDEIQGDYCLTPTKEIMLFYCVVIRLHVSTTT